MRRPPDMQVPLDLSKSAPVTLIEPNAISDLAIGWKPSIHHQRIPHKNDPRTRLTEDFNVFGESSERSAGFACDTDIQMLKALLRQLSSKNLAVRQFPT